MQVWYAQCYRAVGSVGFETETSVWRIDLLAGEQALSSTGHVGSSDSTVGSIRETAAHELRILLHRTRGKHT